MHLITTLRTPPSPLLSFPFPFLFFSLLFFPCPYFHFAPYPPSTTSFQDVDSPNSCNHSSQNPALPYPTLSLPSPIKSGYTPLLPNSLSRTNLSLIWQTMRMTDCKIFPLMQVVPFNKSPPLDLFVINIHTSHFYKASELPSFFPFFFLTYPVLTSASAFVFNSLTRPDQNRQGVCRLCLIIYLNSPPRGRWDATSFFILRF